MQKLILISYMLAFNAVFGQTLHLGNPAPPIKAGQWFKGEPVNNFEKGRIYVIEFWATWCVPCKKSIPHIAKIAEKYKDVTVVGMSVMENNTDLVKPFVDEMGDKMNYTVAVDEQKTSTTRAGFMTDNWLVPAGINAIPSAFIVGKTGLIEWMGSPMDLEHVLDQLIAGHWNAQTFERKQEQKDLVRNMIGQLGDHPDWTALKHELKNKYTYLSADSLVLLLQSTYFYTKKDKPAFSRAYTSFVDKYDTKTNPETMNTACWRLFSYSNNKEDLKKAVGWMKEVVVQYRDNSYYLDTYANLLHKTGDTKNAIIAEQKALQAIDDIFATNMGLSLYRMQIGQPTWEYPEIKTGYINNLAAWQKVKKNLLKFSAHQADSIVAATAIEYAKGKDAKEYIKAIIDFAGRFGADRTDIQLNQDAWEIFTYSNDEKELKLALQWSEESLKGDNLDGYKYMIMDTYANLLYKLNRKEEAVAMEQKAIERCPEQEKGELLKTLGKMQRGEKTW